MVSGTSAIFAFKCLPENGLAFFAAHQPTMCHEEKRPSPVPGCATLTGGTQSRPNHPVARGRSLNGQAVEGLVWADIESFLLQPDRILEQLKKHVSLQDRERPLRQQELDEFLEQREQKVAERDRILGLFRRGRIDEDTLDRQLDLIQNETAALQTQIDTATRLLSAPDRKKQLQSPEVRQERFPHVLA